MKKIININLSGRVLPIEDSAYEKLQAYIESLRRYFANEEGRDEIINDIESRIAELLHDKIRKGADAATDADVKEVIASMGTVEDFEAEEKENASATATASQESNQQNYTYAEKKPRGRLYRDSNDKFIGGVCSGIAAYMNVDPAIVRILFAIVTFGGFGLGFIAYILLWVILPPKDLDGFLGKRLYRNPDDRIIGGVAGGLGAYFGKSVKTIRLIFAAPLVLSMLIGFVNGLRWDHDFDLALNIGFGSLSGTFILTYIILWIVLPEANNEYQKMEMRGEKVDVNRIRQNVKEGMDNMKERMKGWSEEVKQSAQNLSSKAKEFSGTTGKAFASDVNETFRRSSGGLGHAIGVLFKVFFLFIAGTIAFALFVSLIAMLFGGMAWWPINNFLWTSKFQQVMAWLTLILFLIVPLIGFITWIVRRIIKSKSRNNYLGWTFGGLWALGWVAAVLFAGSMAKDFREEEHIDEKFEVSQPVNNKLIVAVSQPELEYTGRFGWMNDGGEGWDLSDDTLKLSAVKFNVKPSTDSLYHVTVKRYSFGKTEQDAISRAEKIQFSLSSRDSILDVANGYAIGKDSKFRGQHIELEIMVPLGKKIRFDESVRRKLNSFNIRVQRSHRRDRVTGVVIDTDDSYSYYRSGVDYIMGIDGELKYENGNPAPTSVDNTDNENDSIQRERENDLLKQQLEDAKREKEETDKKVKELEQKMKTSKPTGFNKKGITTKGKNEESFAGGPSPVSLVEWF
jgi:phage shock protein PspC (stress-responsive transcriptional regulator)